MTKIVGFDTYDVRFPTSRMLDGSDAMNPSPDYSAAALIVRTDAPGWRWPAHALVFTIGRGNDIQLAAHPGAGAVPGRPGRRRGPRPTWAGCPGG